MNIHEIEGNWKQFTVYCKRRWGRLVDEQFDLFLGKRQRPKPVAADKQSPRPEVELPK